MRSLPFALVLGLLLAPATGQTTGTPGLNDFTVNGIASASTSCGFVLATALPMTFALSTAPNVPFVVFIDTCPCRAGFFPLPPVTCTSGVTYPHSLDLQIGAPCILLNFGGTTNAAGNFSITFPACSSPFRFSTQAVVLDPACPPYLMTQAYQVSC